jgi:response regulator RpfG family c-di-GMP phosphodiesterase
MNADPANAPELKRILIVDDEKVVLAALRETLRLEGYEVVGCEDPLTALQYLQTTPFAVILTDQQMPTLTGLEFLAQAKEIQPNATRILITAVLNLATVIDAINKGEVYRFIVKPWLREELLVTIQNASQRYELILRNTLLHEQAVAMNERLAAQLNQLDQQNKRLDELNHALRQNLDRSVQLCVRAIEAFYPLLGQQARRVFSLCRAMGTSLGLPPEQRQVLEISARLYDIGLVGVPRELIRRWQDSPGELSPEETNAIELHPALGQELAGFVAQFEAVGQTIRSHHERFDGAGYPDKLAGDQIPWLARLLGVAVAYSSAPLNEQGAVELVKTESGAAFDPEAVRVFLRCLPQAEVPRSQRAVLFSELKPGMVVAQGIYTAYGLLLIPEGQTLTDQQILLLRNHNRVNPITQSLLVYC